MLCVGLVGVLHGRVTPCLEPANGAVMLVILGLAERDGPGAIRGYRPGPATSVCAAARARRARELARLTEHHATCRRQGASRRRRGPGAARPGRRSDARAGSGCGGEHARTGRGPRVAAAWCRMRRWWQRWCRVKQFGIASAFPFRAAVELVAATLLTVTGGMPSTSEACTRSSRMTCMPSPRPTGYRSHRDHGPESSGRPLRSAVAGMSGCSPRSRVQTSRMSLVCQSTSFCPDRPVSPRTSSGA